MRKLFWIMGLIYSIPILGLGQTPTLSCPANLTVSTDPGQCSAVVLNIDPIVSPSTTEISYTISSTVIETGNGSASGRTFYPGMNTVRYFLTANPTVGCSFIVTVVDKQPPVITCPPNMTINCLSDFPTSIMATATDACTPSHLIDIQVNETRSVASCPDRFLITRVYTATDIAGNSSSCTQLITVHDTIAPVFRQPPPMSPLIVTCAGFIPTPDEYSGMDECDPSQFDLSSVFKEVKFDSTCMGRFSLLRTWTLKDGCGNQTVYTQIVHVRDTIPPVIGGNNFMVSVQCVSEIPEPSRPSLDDNCDGFPVMTFSQTVTDSVCANKLKLVRTWTATDVCGNVSTRVITYNVMDNVPPTFDGIDPPTITVDCEKNIPPAPLQTARDNCGEIPTITLTEVKSNILCANRFTLTRTWTATDRCGNSRTRKQVIFVNDNIPPTVSNITASTVVLWPPNHKMKDVTINYTASDNCGVTSSLSVKSSESVHGGGDGDQAPDWEIVDEHHVRLRAEKANQGQARTYTIYITITDGCNTPVMDSIDVVVAHNINGPQTGHPFKIGSTVSFNGVFWDKPGNTHTAKWMLDGSTATNGTVTEPQGKTNGKVSGSYKFNTPGVYKLQMNVTDQTGVTSYANTHNDLDAIVVVYDPNGGNAFGGGWFASAAGSLINNTSATGKASYGFAVNYRNAAKPKGETQFEFKVGTFEFNALNFDYLAIDNHKAQFRGTGKIIGGQSGIGFIMTVIDGALDGSNIDRIRMKIYNRNTGYVYYDNQPGASDADDPVTAVGDNSTITIQQNNSAPITGMQVERPELNAKSDKLELMVFPNPSNQDFTLQAKSDDEKNKLQVEVYDQQGRLVEKMSNINVSTVFRLGGWYKPGVYLIKVQQGEKREIVKLVKL